MDLFRRHWRSLTVLIALLAAFALVWYLSPRTFLKGVDPAQIARIEVFSGSTGQRISLTESEDIAPLVHSIQSQSLRRSGISLGRMGYSYHLTFYDLNDRVVEEFYLNSAAVLRDDPFFYRGSDDLGYEQLEALF